MVRAALNLKRRWEHGHGRGRGKQPPYRFMRVVRLFIPPWAMVARKVQRVLAGQEQFADSCLYTGGGSWQLVIPRQQQGSCVCFARDP